MLKEKTVSESVCNKKLKLHISVRQQMRVWEILNNLRPSDVAKKLGITAPWYSQIKCGLGLPSTELLHSISNLMGLKLTDNLIVSIDDADDIVVDTDNDNKLFID